VQLQVDDAAWKVDVAWLTGQVRLAANGGGWDVDVAWLTGEVRVHRVQAPR
jgi:general secretion pathway protein H